MRPRTIRGRGVLVLASVLTAVLLVIGVGTPATAARAPRATHVDIASIGVHASVVEVGMTGGAQAVTPSAHVLFHWQHGVVPGNRGSAVLAGHTCLFAPSCAGHGVFNRLGSLKRGNLIRVRVGRHTVTFKVTSVQHNAHPTAKQVRSMYATSGPSRLVLVTCGDPQSDGEYYAHIIVRAKRVK